MSFQGKKNAYCCRKCGFIFVTIDRDDGTTPFLTKCRSDTDCDGTAESSFYNPRFRTAEPTFEWYRPAAAETAALKKPGVIDHVRMGGLLLREIKR